MGPEPEPRATSKGEAKRIKIYRAIKHHYVMKKVDPTIQDIQKMTGIRSFNTITRQLKHLKQDGFIEWDQLSPTVKLANHNRFDD